MVDLRVLPSCEARQLCSRSGSKPRPWGSEDRKCPGEGIGLQKLPASSLNWLTLSPPCGEALCWRDFLRYRPCSFSELFIRRVNMMLVIAEKQTIPGISGLEQVVYK